MLPVAPRNRRRSRRGGNAANDEALAAVKTAADSAKLPFGLRAQLASAAAWSPNPKNPPLYLDLPIGDKEPAVLAKWTANAPLAFIDQYVAGLRRYRAIAIDVGDQDGFASTPASCTTCSISTASRTRSRSTPEPTPATSRFAFRST